MDLFQFIEEFRLLVCKPCGYGIAARTQNMRPCGGVGMVSLALRKAPSASALDEEHFGEQPAWREASYQRFFITGLGSKRFRIRARSNT
jgi:hypothetical protein